MGEFGRGITKNLILKHCCPKPDPFNRLKDGNFHLIMGLYLEQESIGSPLISFAIENLKSLSLRDNLIVEIPQFNFFQLENINLSHNLIREVNNLKFKKLKFLDLSHNRIESLGGLGGVLDLKQLYF